MFYEALENDDCVEVVLEKSTNEFMYLPQEIESIKNVIYQCKDWLSIGVWKIKSRK